MKAIAQSSALFSPMRTQGFSVFRCAAIAVVIGLSFQIGSWVCAQDRAEKKKIEVVVETRGNGVCFVVKNLKDPADARIRVWRSDGDVESIPPMMGTSSADRNDLVFTPRFPIQVGAQYLVSVHPDPDSKPTSFRIEVPGKNERTTEVAGFYPSADKLPENTLKFYVQFSAPMQKGDIYRFLRLREVGGEEVELPFLEIEQEFWSRDSKRLTLLLDPGRIKRGLKPREEMGPILVAGNSYELVIDASWPDANGRKLGKEFVKRFLAVAEDHSQPDPAKWTVTTPTADSRDPLIIAFPEPLDHAMLFLSINVVDSDSKLVSGTVSVSDQETKWSFLPNQDWISGTYRIKVNEDLEDNAGNSIGRPFDVDLFEKTDSSESTPVVELEFDVSK